MKKNTIVFLILAVIAVILMFKLLNVSYAYTKGETSITNDSGNNRITDNTFKDSTFVNSLDRPYCLVFHGITDTSYCDNKFRGYEIDVYVEGEITMGIFRFLPVYKPISVTSDVSYKWKNPLKSLNNQTNNSEFEKFRLQGHYNIFGTLSAKKAETETKNFINKAIQNKIKTDIENKLKHKV